MIFKLLLPLLLTALTVEATTITAAAQQAAYSSGDLVQINVSVSDVADLYAFQFDLSFDPTALAAQSVTEAGYFLSNGVSFFPGVIDNAGGSVSFIADSLTGSGPSYSGNTTLATIAFRALADGTTLVAPDNVVLLDSSLSDIPASINPATVTIASGSVAPEPMASGLLGLGLIILGGLMSRRRAEARESARL